MRLLADASNALDADGMHAVRARSDADAPKQIEGVVALDAGRSLAYKAIILTILALHHGRLRNAEPIEVTAAVGEIAGRA